MDTAYNTTYHIQMAKRTLAGKPYSKIVPRDPNNWKQYVKSLREEVLDMPLESFWGMFGIKTPTGHKYESPKDADDPNKSRNLKLHTMKLIMDTLDLVWEPTSKFGEYSAITRNYVLTDDGKAAIGLLNASGLELKDLEALLLLHSYYKSHK